MRTAHNVVANVGGRLWTLVMNFAFIPLYVRFMGVEAYGLVGVFATMLAVFGILDMGFSLTVNRELARLGATGELARARDLTRTLEVAYWLLGAAIAVVIFLGAGFITHRWLNLASMPAETATNAVRLMAVVALLRWPVALYMGALMGLRRHVALNLVTVGCATLAGAGAVVVLWLVSPSVIAFFTWQLVAAAIQILLLAVVTWRKLRLPGHHAAFDPHALRPILRFSAGIFGVTVMSVVLMQLDKLVLSSTLSLADFGYYTLAFTVGNVLATIGLAIHGALFPSLSHVVAVGEEPGIATFYHRCCQLMAAVVVPAALALAFFAHDLLLLYLRDAVAAARLERLVELFAVANMIFAVMMMPYALQLAFGWTRLSLYKNMAAILVYIPALLAMVHFLGATGAAAAWLALMVGYLLVEVRIMHRRLLPGEVGRWYARDVGLPVLVGVVLIGGARLAAGASSSLPLRLAACTGAAGIAVLAIVATAPELRRWALDVVAARRLAARA